MNEQKAPNRLINETSPYLLQHAYNPVDWYPWCEEALQKAKQENKPILLSIGYSACHWCHVMEHESFEDEDTAALMNELFVSIKVDREERPDLDKIYQFAHQLLTQRSGGWPLNMFLTPDDQTPFFGGTYFPPTTRHGMPPFKEIMKKVVQFYREHPEDIGKQNDSVKEYMRRASEGRSPENNSLDAKPLVEARKQLEGNYDEHFGGFGGAPKFPHPTNIERLLRHWHGSTLTEKADDKALAMARNTLHAMVSGGLYDQLGGGFCRYSVDEEWMIPHFEKMLYDNGPLLVLYADAWAATGDNVFRRATEETAEWVIREMQSPEGGYYSTLDADSEEEEGKFYVWQLSEVQQLLDQDEYEVAKLYYGLSRIPNFEGGWHLHVTKQLDDVAQEINISPDKARHSLDSARKKLFTAREKRVHPGRDEKILTSWNGLMIKGMAVAGRRLSRDDFIESAERALDFIRNTLWVDGRLLATYKDNKAHLNAYLDDYVFLVDGILSLLEARWRDGDLQFAIELINVVLDHFSAEEGGFYFTADDHEQLIQRPRPWMDEATPAGNGIAAQVLLRLGYLLGNADYIDAAESTLNAAWYEIEQFPHAHNALLTGLEEFLSPTETVIIRGPAKTIKQWQMELAKDYAPKRIVLTIPEDAASLPDALADYAPEKGRVLAYVCRDRACQAPVSELNQLREAFLTDE
jgi:uncharacterized protein YyaL (SSP411 family)